MKNDQIAHDVRELAAGALQEAVTLLTKKTSEGAETWDPQIVRAEALIRAAEQCRWIAGDHDDEIPRELTLNVNLVSRDVTE